MYAKRVDLNHKEIVDGLRRAHRSVFSTHAVGRDFPDLVVGYQGRTFLVEIKSEKGKLSQGQREFAESWRGSPVLVVKNLEEAIRLTEPTKEK